MALFMTSKHFRLKFDNKMNLNIPSKEKTSRE